MDIFVWLIIPRIYLFDMVAFVWKKDMNEK